MTAVILLRETLLLLPSPMPALVLAPPIEVPSPTIILPPPETPNTKVSRQLDAAYSFYNRTLFGNILSPAYVHLHRKKRAYGYFWAEEMSVDDERIHEIALDPDKLNRPIENVLSTVVHEMVHFWQEDHGQKVTKTAHNKEWAAKMESLGLMPSSTGAPGGRRTGQRVSHYIIEGGPFDVATKELLKTGYQLTVKGRPKGTFTKRYRTTLRCPSCRDTALAKPTIKLICGNCNVPMEDKYPR